MAIKQVVTPLNLGPTIKPSAITANKYDVNVDNVTLVVNGSGVISTALDPAKVDALVALSGLPALTSDLGTFSGATIPDASTVKGALQALETAVEAINITGQYLGSAATFAALPVVDSAGVAANNADWAILTADDGANQAGIYAYNGTAFSLVSEIPNSFVMAATVISPAATDATGLVGTSLDYARADHKHPAQGVSADADQMLGVGSDGLHLLKLDPVAGNLLTQTAAGIKVAPADVKAALTFDTEVQDAFGVTLFYANSTPNFA